MFQAAVFLVLFAIAYSLFGTPMLGAGAIASIVFLTWFSAPPHTPIDVDGFIKADAELVRCIADLKLATEDVPFEFDKVREKIRGFIEIYILCFNDAEALKHQFDNLTYMRRDILNAIEAFGVEGFDCEAALAALAKCTAKYVDAVVKKHELAYARPIAANEYGAHDVY